MFNKLANRKHRGIITKKPTQSNYYDVKNKKPNLLEINYEGPKYYFMNNHSLIQLLY